MNHSFQPLFDSLSLKSGITLKNRLVVAPMTHYASNPDGTISEEELAFIAPRSEGFGMVITACANVTADGKAFPGQPAVNSDETVEGLKKLADTIKAKGAKAVLQIHHGGRQCPKELVPNKDVVAPSQVEGIGGHVARELKTSEIEAIITAFGDATKRAIQAGFDGVEIHGANGYLIHQFVSGFTNKREDKWGGSLENRLAFPLAIVDAVKQAVEENATSPFIVGYRLSPEEPEEDGLTMTDTFALADALATKSLDYLHVSVVDFFSHARRGADTTRTRLDLIQERVGNQLPIIGVGSLYTADDVLKAFETGIPLIALGREVLIDPSWVTKVKEGRENDIQTKLKKDDKERLHFPNNLWQGILNAPGWVPFED